MMEINFRRKEVAIITIATYRLKKASVSHPLTVTLPRQKCLPVFPEGRLGCGEVIECMTGFPFFPLAGNSRSHKNLRFFWYGSPKALIESLAQMLRRKPSSSISTSSIQRNTVPVSLVSFHDTAI
jgi:hypothetical protein